MFFKKKKEIPKFTFYNPSETNLVENQLDKRKQYAVDAKSKLNKMIGLENVKKWIDTQEAIIKANNAREDAGLYIKNNQTMHMILTGNPGTGKTECARIISKIYYGLGVLPTDSFLEISRKDLVSDAHQSSSQKVAKVIKEAFGGVLFIDEAYSVCYGEHDQSGREAVDALLKAMEDHRDNLAVIMAGYTNEMNDFLKTNPGFESRIPPQNIVKFEDYNENECVQIFKYMVEEHRYLLGEDVTDTDLIKLIKKMPKTKGNARDIRNLIDSLKRDLDLMLSTKEIKNHNELITISKEIIERFM